MTSLRRLGLLAILGGCTTFEGASVDGARAGSGGAGQAGSPLAGAAGSSLAGAAGSQAGAGQAGAGQAGAGQSGAGQAGVGGAGPAGAGGDAGAPGAGQAGAAGISGSSGQSGEGGQGGTGGAGGAAGSGPPPVAQPFDAVVRQAPAYTGPQPFTPRTLATVIYVAGEDEGDDLNPGTQAKPLRSLGGVAAYLAASGSSGGLSIRLRRGSRVRGSLELKDGSSLSAIEIGPYGDPALPPPELNDEEPSPPLTPDAPGSRRFSAVLPYAVQRVFARVGGVDVEGERAWLSVPDATYSLGYLAGAALLDRPELASAPATAHVWSSNPDRTRQYRAVTAYDPAKGLLLSPAPSDGAGVEVFVHGHASFIDQDLEWHQDKEVKDGGRRFTIQLPPGETAESLQLRLIPEAREFALQPAVGPYERSTATLALLDASAVTIEGLRFRRPPSIAIGVGRGDAITVQHCIFDDLDAPALVSRPLQTGQGGTEKLVFEHNAVTGVNQGLLRLSNTKGARVARNRSATGPGRNRRGLLDTMRIVSTQDTTIESNHIDGARARMISGQSNPGLVLARNVLIDPAQKNGDDYAVLFQTEPDTDAVQIRQNVFYAGKTPDTMGLRLYTSTSSGTIEGNLMVNQRGGINVQLDGDAKVPAWDIRANTLLVSAAGVTAQTGVGTLRGNHLELLGPSGYTVSLGTAMGASIGQVDHNAHVGPGTKALWQSCTALYKCTPEASPSWVDATSPVLRDEWYTATPPASFIVFNPSLEPVTVLTPGTSGAWHGLTRADDDTFTVDEWAAGAPLTVPAFGWRVLQRGPRP